MKVLFDLNIVLDVILNRQPWVMDSSKLWDAHHNGEIDGFMAATEITNLFYIVRQQGGEPLARMSVAICLGTFSILNVDLPILQSALNLNGVDFEDDVCTACANQAVLDFIVTRDATGFAHSSTPAITPADLVKQLNQLST